MLQIKDAMGSVYNIVGDGMVSSPIIGEGRFIPFLIINADINSEISDLIRFHQNTPAGDAVQQWGTPISLFPAKIVILQVKFVQPMAVNFCISFDIKAQFSLVDGIIQSRAFYLQTGVLGDKVSDLKGDKILIESPDTGFDSKWDGILFKTIKSKYKSSSNKVANQLATSHIKSMRDVWNNRRG